MASFFLNRRVDLVEVSTNEANPNVLYIDRDAETILVQTAPDRFELRKGRWLMGMVTFCENSDMSGWKFEPHGSTFRPSRKLFRFPEGAVGRKIRIARVYSDGCHSGIA